MDDPPNDIIPIIHTLIQASPKDQEAAINNYFTPDAGFTHPFCRTGSFQGSRWLIHAIFRWYKILSPRIELEVKSVAYDETNLLLYVTIYQLFSIWFIPFHRSPVTLTTVLQLTQPPHSGKYYISSQNDLYQVDQFVKFFAPWGEGTIIVYLWNLIAALFCVFGALIFAPQTWVEQALAEWKAGRIEGGVNGAQTPGGSVGSTTTGVEGEGWDDRDVKAVFGFSAENTGGGGGRQGVQQFGSTQVVR